MESLLYMLPGAILSLGCALLSTGAKTVGGGGLLQPLLEELGLKLYMHLYFVAP